MTLEAILFDVDGTLADTEGLGHHPAYNQAFDSLGVPFRWDRDLYRTLLKQPGGRERIRHYLDAYAPELGPESAAVARDPDQWIAKVHQLKSDFFRDRVAAGQIPLRAGVERLICEARDAGIRLAIVSNASRRTLDPVLEFSLRPELRAAIEVIASGEEVTHKKPHPMLYQLALQRMGLTAAQCVAVEDSAMGLAAAKAAGLAALVTINEDTRDQNFAGAGLIVSSLGGPGDPVWVYRGDMGHARWVTVKVLAGLLASGQKT
ncbi:MAG: HAD-IA family hydrolase [Polycyclovorans sp.]|jgi:HAD superfamily hydrolase (TIGR01509 family)|nr:HAD-IA family hydrolase [Gammaproteobacteria bacterium]MDP1543193.1 HAD-IA family hydrolase [Polycyclovorans sp.]MEC8850256.1 HAD-IA family hydrolase [Pseudomonadota bacterium]|tara:strand:- start:5192 stop:5977 length:786 start_codon:yes stop_codon:yes gene_type:complete